MAAWSIRLASKMAGRGSRHNDGLRFEQGISGLNPSRPNVSLQSPRQLLGYILGSCLEKFRATCFGQIPWMPEWYLMLRQVESCCEFECHSFEYGVGRINITHLCRNGITRYRQGEASETSGLRPTTPAGTASWQPAADDPTTLKGDKISTCLCSSVASTLGCGDLPRAGCSPSSPVVSGAMSFLALWAWRTVLGG